MVLKMVGVGHMVDRFAPGVIKKIGYCVYLLIDPRDGNHACDLTAVWLKGGASGK